MTNSNPRGGGSGQWGEKGKGFSGTCIKDTWTKPKGVGLRSGGGGDWGWGQWCGENGDSCT